MCHPVQVIKKNPPHLIISQSNNVILIPLLMSFEIAPFDISVLLSRNEPLTSTSISHLVNLSRVLDDSSEIILKAP